MTKSNLILIGGNVALMASGVLVINMSNRNSRAMQALSPLILGVDDVIGSADMDNDGQITMADALYVKSCVTSLGMTVSNACRGTWQQVTSDSPPDGIIKFQKVGHADINDDGKVTLGDVMWVKGCVGTLPPDPCYGQLRPRIAISGTVVNQAGIGIPGVTVRAPSFDADGDPIP